MRTTIERIQRAEFEARILVSLAIVGVVLAAAYGLTPNAPSVAARIGEATGLEPRTAHASGFLVAGGLLLGATLLRMWAGTVLTSRRVMAFEVQSDTLATRGPYRLTRNPIYLADLTAFVGFALVLPPIGLLLPLLLRLHYAQIIRHEERALAAAFGARYADYVAGAPRFFPTPRSLRRLCAALAELDIGRDGIRHNALYVLFLPGMLVAFCTGTLWHAALVGLPGVVDWAVVHTRIGRHRTPVGGEVGRDAS